MSKIQRRPKLYHRASALAWTRPTAQCPEFSHSSSAGWQLGDGVGTGGVSVKEQRPEFRTSPCPTSARAPNEPPETFLGGGEHIKMVLVGSQGGINTFW